MVTHQLLTELHKPRLADWQRHRHVALRHGGVASRAAAAWGAATILDKKDQDRLKDRTKDRADCNVNSPGFFWQGQWRWWSLDVSTVCHLTLPCWQWSKSCGTRRVLNNKKKKKANFYQNSIAEGEKPPPTVHISQRESILSWLTLLNCLHSCFVCGHFLCHCALCAFFSHSLLSIIIFFFLLLSFLSPFLHYPCLSPLSLTPPPNHTIFLVVFCFCFKIKV